MKRFKNKIYSDFFWTFITQVIILFSNFLLNKIFATNLGTEGFGILNIARRGATLIGFLMLSGQGLAIVKFLAYEKHNKEKNVLGGYILSGFKIIASISLVIIILILLFSSGFSQLIFDSIQYKKLILPMLFFALSMSISTYIISVFRGLGQFTIFNGIQIVSQVTILIIFMLNKNQTVTQIMFKWGIIAISIPIIIAILKLIKNKNHFNLKRNKKLTLNLLKYGLPRTPGEFIQFSYYLVPLIIVNRKFGEIETSLFSASTGILQLFLPFFSYIGLILLPHTSSAISAGKFDSIKKKINKGAIFYLIISIVSVFIGVLITPTIIKILYSSEFLSGVTVARILLISLIPRSLFLLLRNPIDAISNKAYNTYNLFFSFIIMVIMMEGMKTPKGIAISFVISDFILCCLSIYIWSMSSKIIEREENMNEKI